MLEFDAVNFEFSLLMLRAKPAFSALNGSGLFQTSRG